MGNLSRLLGDLFIFFVAALLKIFRDFDIGDTVQCLRYYAGWADKIIGQVSEFDKWRR